MGSDPGLASSRPPRLTFIGSYAPASAPGIHMFLLDESAETLVPLEATAGVENPSFLALHPGGEHLFAVEEVGGGSPGAVHAFRIEKDGRSASLQPLNRQPSEGEYPCHLLIDRDGSWLIVSNYGSGSGAVLPILADGSLGPPVARFQHAGSGPNAGRQEGPHLHSTIFAPNGRHLIAADLGIDRLVVYEFDGSTGGVTGIGDVPLHPGAGPRHLAFHPDGVHLFVVGELDSTVSVMRSDGSTGELRLLQTLPTTGAGAPENTAADLHLSPAGDFVYVSNRGDDSIAVFAFDPEAGLRPSTVRPSGGIRPRGFRPAPGGSHLLVANRDSNEIVLLPLLDGGAGLGAPVARAAVEQPSWIAFG